MRRRDAYIYIYMCTLFGTVIKFRERLPWCILRNLQHAEHRPSGSKLVLIVFPFHSIRFSPIEVARTWYDLRAPFLGMQHYKNARGVLFRLSVGKPVHFCHLQNVIQNTYSLLRAKCSIFLGPLRQGDGNQCRWQAINRGFGRLMRQFSGPFFSMSIFERPE